MSTTAARSLTEWLRAQPDSALADLLRARPDLLVPAPGDIGTLAGRAAGRFSVIRALDELDAFTLHVLDGVLVLEFSPDGRSRPDYPTLAAMLPDAPPAAVREAVDRLLALALLWGDDDGLHPTGQIREGLSPYPAGLGRPAAVLLPTVSSTQLAPVLAALGLPPRRQPEAGQLVAEALTDPARLDALLAAAGPREREVLDQLAAGPPVGTVRDALRPALADEAETPVRWLLAHGLLIGVDPETVELPREVGLALRGDLPLGQSRAQPPALPVTDLGESTVDETGAGQALNALRLAETLAEGYAADPPADLRSGGLSVRDLRRTARSLDVSEPTAALYVEIMRAAGLLDRSGGMAQMWLPTSQYDAWLGLPAARRWAQIAHAWLGMPRLPWLVGQRDDRGRALAALSPDVDRTSAPGLRRRVLGVLAEQPAGVVVQSGEELAGRLAWLAPRRGIPVELVLGILAEAESLGITGRAGLTSYGRALLGGRDPVPLLTERLPAPVSQVLVQADLTVIAPGPLEPDLARDVALVADVESAGGATVYRVTEATVRRALDAGRTASDLHELFRSRSATPVPQALTYLVDDVARRHGALRVGAATAYLRCDDEGLLAQVLADRRTGPLKLRRIAPTVLASRSAVSRVLEVLRGAGYAPVGESAEGAVVLTRPDAQRADPRPAPARFSSEPPVPTDAQLAELVRALRAGEAAAQRGRAHQPPAAGETVIGGVPSVTLNLLRQAAQAGQAVALGYVNAQGSASRRIVEPVSVSGGYLHGYDHKRDEMRTFALHRITAVSLLADGEDGVEEEG
jgi:Helicase conserved C-terminal domain/WYL domain